MKHFVRAEQVMEQAETTFADKRVYTYLDGKGEETANYSLGEVLLYARRIGAYLQVIVPTMQHVTWNGVFTYSSLLCAVCVCAARGGPSAG
jgi:hypothetical protein